MSDSELGRKHSLQREWSRTFVVLLFLLVLAAGTTFVGVRIVVGELQSTAIHLRLETNTIAKIRAQVMLHEETAHKLLSNETINRSAFLNQQQYIVHLFSEASLLYPPGHQGYLAFTKARYSWQYGLTSAGLWGNAVYLMSGDHSFDNPIYGASSDGTVALLDSLEQPILLELDSGIARGRTFEQTLFIVLIGVFIVALSVTEYSRRRMIKNLLHPLGTLHESAMRLEAGDYEHRIEISRNDEIGDLDVAFNAMADAMRSHQMSLEHRASHDLLTGLPNRASMAVRLAASFGPSPERRSPSVSLLYIDIDDFKGANDLLGHEGGDELLIKFAERLVGCTRPYDLVCRLGGDEFAVVVAEDHEGIVASDIAQRVLSETRAPFTIGDTHLNATVSIGIATQMADMTDASVILRNADFAMYRAKHAGKDRLEVFNGDDSPISKSNSDI